MKSSGPPLGSHQAPQHHTDLYLRITHESPRRRLFAQALFISAARSAMTVEAHPDALDVDFRKYSTRSDVPGEHRGRPGFLLADELRRARDDGRRVVMFNGNNIGYWGNQYVIQSGVPDGKRRGPIFDDQRLADHTFGRFTFFTRSGSRYRISEINLRAVAQDPTQSDIGGVRPFGRTDPEPEIGLSGFPLVRDGRSVWRANVAQAWDPHLLYDLPRSTSRDRTALVMAIEQRRAADKDSMADAIGQRTGAAYRGGALVRHAMTLVGVDKHGDAIVVAVEKSDRSAGVSVAGAAGLMLEFGATDAIALGAAGDTQLASTYEGFLVSPLVESHSRPYAPHIPSTLWGDDVSGMPMSARPVPCLVTIGLSVPRPVPVPHRRD